MYNVVTLFYFTAWAFSYTDWFSLKSILFKFFFYLTAIKDIKESENIASLHNQIASCDTILAVSWYFQYDIYQVSHQIQFQLIPGTFSTSVEEKCTKYKNFLPSMDSSNFLYLSSYPFFLGLVLMISRYPSLQYIVYFNDKIISIKSIFSTSFNILQLFSTFIQTEDNTNNAKPQFIDSILLL